MKHMRVDWVVEYVIQHLLNRKYQDIMNINGKADSVDLQHYLEVTKIHN